jgi:cyclopropane fatty-acyl-phospholipid synthase-like methyltransferase
MAAAAPGDEWRDGALAKAWAQGDRLEGLLALPRRITADVLALAETPVATVLDVGSGPGAFLRVVLERLPSARGIWTDVSEPMRAIATERLASFGDRVDFRLADATELDGLARAGSIDAIVTSRVTHHLDPDGLSRFYASSRDLLGDRGWIANLDHVSVPQPWSERFTRARLELVPPNPSPHQHDRPHPTLEDHLAALDACGGFDVAVAWRAYATVLILAARAP